MKIATNRITKSAWLVASAGTALALTGGDARAYSITTFGPGAFDADTAAMDVALGLSPADFSNIQIYNFDGWAAGLNAIDGLSVTGLDTSTDNSNGFKWDTSRVQITATPANSSVVFSFDDGTEVFGIGLGAVTFSGWSIVVNEGLASEETLASDLTGTNLSIASQARNGYVRITGTGLDGAPIQTVTFTNDSGSTDGVSYDHLAYTVIPEPASLSLGLVGLGALAARRRRIA